MRLPWSNTKKLDQPSLTLESSASSGHSIPQNGRQTEVTTTLEVEKRPIISADLHEENAAEITVIGKTGASQTREEEKEVKIDDEREGELLPRTASAATASTDSGAPGEDDESKYPKALPLYLLTLGLVLSTFVVALDNTIIATAIPKITTVFNSLNDVGWYGSSYLLTTTSLQPSFGKIYTYFNVKWTYILALLIFELGSVLCGAAVNSTMLIVGRAVAGVGAAALFSGSMIIVAYSVPLRKRPIYIGLISSMFGIASVVGPILGGAFTDRECILWCPQVPS